MDPIITGLVTHGVVSVSSVSGDIEISSIQLLVSVHCVEHLSEVCTERVLKFAVIMVVPPAWWIDSDTNRPTKPWVLVLSEPPLLL